MRKLYLLLTALAMATFSYGQVSYLTNYVVDGGNPGGINTESDAPGQTTWTTLVPGPQAANIWSPTAAIPFPFDFFGNPVTHFKASQNGLVTFDTMATALPNANAALPDVNLPDQVICGMWDEFTASAPTGSGDDIRYNTFGVAPNRQFWITWYSFEMGNPTASFNYFSVVLEETSNKIFMVDKYSTTAQQLTPTIGVQLDATTAVMYGTVPAPNSGNGSANTDNDYFEFCPFLLVNDNAAMESFTSIVPPAMAGMNNVDVIVSNTGQNTINSLMVNWSINGAPQTPVAYNTAIPSFGNAPVSLGSGMLADGDTVCAWTSMPNGNPDADPSDDTLCIVFCSGLNGIYSIGGATPDYNSMWEAGEAVNGCGVLGPVEFVIAPGTYADSLRLGDVPGASALNTVTFNGGSRDLVNITNGPGGQEAIVYLEGADYTTIKNITFDHSGTTDAWGVLFQDSASFNMIDSCRFNMGQGTDISAILASNSTTDDFVEGNNANYCTISNNEFNGGDYAIHLEGRGTDYEEFMNGMQILNNNFDGYNLYGIYCDNQDSLVASGNTFRNPLSAGADGIYCFDMMNFDIRLNNIVVPDYGIYVSDGNFDGPPDGVSIIENNMVLSSSDYALYLDDVNDVNIWHNTLSGNPGMRINDFFNMDIRNNIFTSNGDYAYESDEPSDQEIVENNLYWTPASNSLFIKDGTGIYADLGLWQGNVPAINSASVEARPFFVAADDLHLVGQNGNDAGDPGLGVTVDIDGDVRPLAPSVLPDIGADEYSPLSNDAVFLNFVDLNNFACGDSMIEILVAFQNQGDAITSLPIAVEVGGATPTILSMTYTDTLNFGESDTISMGFINSYAGGTFTFLGYTQLAGEQDASNDSSSLTTITFVPFVPTGADVEVCGVDTAVLIGDPTYPVAYEWYDSATGGNLVGSGAYTVPSIAAQSTYYVQYGASNDSLVSTYAAGNGCGGGNMFDVTANASTRISGFSVNNSQAVGTPITITVHYINNSTYVGNETNAAAWTTEGTYTVNSAGANNPTTFFLNNPIFIAGGQVNAIYVEYNAQYTNGTSAYTNGFLTVQMGVGLCSAFGGTNQGREFNGAIYYESEACSAERTPVTATSLAAPMVDIGPDSTYCTTASTITLDAGSGQTQYDWSTSDTTQTVDVGSGSYSVVVTAANGCTSEDSIDITLNIPPTVSLGPDTSVCVGQSVVLSANSSGTVGCLWSNGATTPSIAVSAPGDYSVICTDTNGCEGTDTTNVTLVFAPVAAFTATQNGSAGLGFDFTDNSTGGATSWSWDFGDATGTSTAQNPSYSYNTGGSYTVTLIVDNGCGLDTLTQTLMPVGIADGLAQTMEVYPNPAQDRATVRLVGLNSEDLHLELYNLQGQRVMEQSFSSLQQEIEVQLDLSGLAAGTYYLRATGQEGSATRKLTVE